MAQECTDQSSVTIYSSTPPNWWDLHHPSPWNPSNLSISMSSCEGDHVSISTCFTDASNHSGLTVDSTRQIVDHHHHQSCSNEFMDEHVSDSQLWTHILLGTGSNGEFCSNQEVGDNLVGALSSNSTAGAISPGIFEPACDYLKKMDSDWEFTSSPSSNNNNNFGAKQQVNGFNPQSLIESKRLTKLVNRWSIAPPHDAEVNRRLDTVIPCNDISLSSSSNQYDQYPTSYGLGGKRNYSGFLSPLYHDHIKMEKEIEEAGSLSRRSFSFNDLSYDIGNPMAGDYRKHYCAVPDATCTSARSFSDLEALNGIRSLTKPLVGIQVPKANYCRKQKLQSPSLAGRGHGALNEGRKKRSEDASVDAALVKKPKQESSTAAKMQQAPKAKIADKITALQQIVSPFGKTDTASVLLEAIQYIKFLHEQVQLLSNPYMKNIHRDHWGGLEIKEKGDRGNVLDLGSKGLCLVPISCTPQAYHDNTGSDFWTPTYRGCLFR